VIKAERILIIIIVGSLANTKAVLVLAERVWYQEQNRHATTVHNPISRDCDTLDSHSSSLPRLPTKTCSRVSHCLSRIRSCAQKQKNRLANSIAGGRYKLGEMPNRDRFPGFGKLFLVRLASALLASVSILMSRSLSRSLAASRRRLTKAQF
jgi:hypothetical protein